MSGHKPTEHSAAPPTGTPRIRLHAGRGASVQRRHPWVFSGAIDRVEGNPGMGDIVAVCDADGSFLAWGQYSPSSQIRVRLASWRVDDAIEEPSFWKARIERAVAARQVLVPAGTTACRLVNGESDGVPGLIADLYGDCLVVQFLTAGGERRRDLLVGALSAAVGPSSVYERSDVDVRSKEGLPPRAGLLIGKEPPPLVRVRENGLNFDVDVRQGHKTGFYLDQRENRALVGTWLRRQAAARRPPRVLNAFSYTGGFAVYALAAGAASVVNIDKSAPALALAAGNARLNGFADALTESLDADAFQALRDLQTAGRRFDAVILDPPKFAFAQKDVDRAARGYKDINLQAFRLLDEGGLLFTFSCSGAISPDLFQKIVFGAALDSGRTVQIVGSMTQAADHPVDVTFPESAYLKGLICRVV